MKSIANKCLYRNKIDCTFVIKSPLSQCLHFSKESIISIYKSILFTGFTIRPDLVIFSPSEGTQGGRTGGGAGRGTAGDTGRGTVGDTGRGTAWDTGGGSGGLGTSAERFRRISPFWVCTVYDRGWT